MNKFDTIIEKWVDTFKKSNIKSSTVKGGWMVKENELEVFELPPSGNEFKDAATQKGSLRMGWNGQSKTMYFWNSNVLHFTVEVLLKKPFQYKFLYNIKDTYMILKESPMIETLYNDKNWKKCMENIDKNLKRVKNILISGKLVPVKDFLK